MPENILPPGADTLLTISGFGQLLYQARGLTQQLKVIRESIQKERDINGTLQDLSDPAFRKYSTKIVCTDVNMPPLDGIWPGMEITVGFAMEVCGTLPGTPQKPQVSGSYREANGFYFYRMSLAMMVIEPDPGSFDEWRDALQWGLEAEEV